MRKPTTRRDFLKVSTLSAAAVAGSGTLTPNSVHAAPKAGEISVWVTNENQRCAPGQSIAWQAGSATLGAATIVLDPGKKFQPILGFGAAFTDAACFTFNRLDAPVREKLFHELFHPSEMEFNVCRTCIGSSDYSTETYSFDEGEPDPDLQRFSIDHDRAYLLPMLREARKSNPDLFLFSSPWSPPGWMKPNKSLLGGNMQRKYMPSYANYFVKFLQGYEAEGVPIQAVTVQNEVDTDQDGRMPQCTWPMEYEADFVRQNLGPTFERAGTKAKIWIIDHNYNLWGRAMGELETPGVRKYTNAIAWHGYVGQVEWIDRVQSAYPDVEMYWTEGGPDYTMPDYLTDWAKWSKTFTGILRHWCRSITSWNFALDEHGKPNIGPFNCGGLVQVHSQTKELTYCGQYWAFAHYTKFIKRNAHRFDSQSTNPDLLHVAFENPDGRRVVVLTNPGLAQACQLQLGNQSASVRLEQNSVTTLQWS
ncbi:MAG TPA: glycoside hydrolase family 30 beta sandwich domain-containing protein [Terriglobales bacterium]|nr:glycoside hydrolase family 30 beta sandwich domain-containing protein [Terriglobales bacterium]